MNVEPRRRDPNGSVRRPKNFEIFKDINLENAPPTIFSLAMKVDVLVIRPGGGAVNERRSESERVKQWVRGERKK